MLFSYTHSIKDTSYTLRNIISTSGVLGIVGRAWVRSTVCM